MRGVRVCQSCFVVRGGRSLESLSQTGRRPHLAGVLHRPEWPCTKRVIISWVQVPTTDGDSRVHFKRRISTRVTPWPQVLARRVEKWTTDVTDRKDTPQFVTVPLVLLLPITTGTTNATSARSTTSTISTTSTHSLTTDHFKAQSVSCDCSKNSLQGTAHKTRTDSTFDIPIDSINSMHCLCDLKRLACADSTLRGLF